MESACLSVAARQDPWNPWKKLSQARVWLLKHALMCCLWPLDRAASLWAPRLREEREGLTLNLLGFPGDLGLFFDGRIQPWDSSKEAQLTSGTSGQGMNEPCSDLGCFSFQVILPPPLSSRLAGLWSERIGPGEQNLHSNQSAGPLLHHHLWLCERGCQELERIGGGLSEPLARSCEVWKQVREGLSLRGWGIQTDLPIQFGH